MLIGLHDNTATRWQTHGTSWNSVEWCGLATLFITTARMVKCSGAHLASSTWHCPHNNIISQLNSCFLTMTGDFSGFLQYRESKQNIERMFALRRFITLALLNILLVFGRHTTCSIQATELPNLDIPNRMFAHFGRNMPGSYGYGLHAFGRTHFYWPNYICLFPFPIVFVTP